MDDHGNIEYAGNPENPNGADNEKMVVSGGFLPERAQPFAEVVDTDDLAPLTKRARTYARNSKTNNTKLAYAADWKDYTRWCADHGLLFLPASPQTVGLYITALASEARPGRTGPAKVETIERRLSGIAWNYRQRGDVLDRQDPHVKTVLDGIRLQHGERQNHKMALLAPDIIRMVNILDKSLMSLRDRAILLVGFAGGLRRSEIVGLDYGPKETEDGLGWPEFFANGLLLHIKGKTGWREVEIGLGSSADTCPIQALEEWLRVAKIEHGPIFRKLTPKKDRVISRRLAGQHVARLIQQTALASGVGADFPEGVRRHAFSGHSLRAGLATGADVDERYVQRQLGHATVGMTRRYQRDRDRFKVNLTKAAGL